MLDLLNIFGFLSVVLRAMTLACQSLVAGGVLFGLICLNPALPEVWNGTRRLIRWSAIALTLAQIAFVLTDAGILQVTAELPWSDIVTANFFIAGAASALAALFFVFFSRRLRPGNWLTLIPAAVMLASSVMTSHSAARMDNRVPAVIFTALHQTATVAWIGGLPFLLIALTRARGLVEAGKTGSRFSRMAMVSVAAIIVSGVGLSFLYIGSIPALYGTSYGLMVMGKAFMLLLVMGLGALNYFIVRATHDTASPLLLRLRRFSEAEIGIGFTIILAAASLTSQPPAIDVRDGRATIPEIVERFTPRPPRLSSPKWSELSAPTIAMADPDKLQSFVPGGGENRVSGAGDMAWSEYNHNWSGLAVLLIGVMAVLSRVFGLKWARHWPLAFLGLALFLLIRADPEAWPLGPKGFWYSMTSPDVLQHRLFALLITAFAIFEWGVDMGRIQSKAASLAFPAVCALGGALLLTHTHALGNVREEYLAEASHLPIAIFAVMAGWSRWLEQRLDSGLRRIPSMIWPVCFVCIGLMLLFYRES